jgi:hydroxyacylglutathione hydrolase
MFLRQLFDPALAQYSYLIGCQKSGEACVIDPERDVQLYLDLAKQNDLQVRAVAETHIHADFVSGSQELAAILPDLQLYLSDEGGPDWTYKWSQGMKNVRLLRHGQTFNVGNIQIQAVHTPGHTPEHLSFLITDRGGGADEPIAIATGDFLFVGDVGRPDLLETAAGAKGVMEPSARNLQKSLATRLTALADYVQVLPGHGAGSACGKSLGAVPTSTLGYERRQNAPLRTALTDAEQFIREILSGQPEPPLYFARMKQVNRDGIAVTGGPVTPPPLTPKETVQAVERGAVALDTRIDPETFDASHLPQAIHAPLGTKFFSVAAGSYVDADEAIVLLVSKESEVTQAVLELYRIGFDKIIGWITVTDIADAGLATASIPRLPFEEFDEDRVKQSGAIIDVRTASEFVRGHIENAISLPYTRIKTRLDELPKDTLLHVYCGSGARAALAASFLRARGYEVVHVDGICQKCEAIALAEGVPH